MIQQKTKTNYTDENLWCVYSKVKIEIGEEYILIIEHYQCEKIEKAYKLEFKDYIDEE